MSLLTLIIAVKLNFATSFIKIIFSDMLRWIFRLYYRKIEFSLRLINL